MEPRDYRRRALTWMGIWGGLALLSLGVGLGWPTVGRLPFGGTLFQLIAMVVGVLALTNAFAVITQVVFAHRKRPPIEGVMVSRLYRVAAFLGILVILMYAFGRLASAGTFFAAFGGLLLGWSLQAPVSGFAAWVLISLKRPFRGGDRIQFPNLGLTGDVVDIGPMYTVLDQVGGTIGSEEAVGRFILVPNAMLFSQVVINYTVRQEMAYMLDEVVVRITYDSDWDEAERILLNAAAEITRDTIIITGVQPYIRSDLYDYGVYLRLRYQTRVKDRAEIAYNINKRIFEDLQRTPSVDIAIPFVYSYRMASDRKEEEAAMASDRKEEGAAGPPDQEARKIQEIDLEHIQSTDGQVDAEDIQQVAQSIAARGLLQPIVVVRNPHGGMYDILAGHVRFEAVKRLGWKTIPAVVREPGGK